MFLERFRRRRPPVVVQDAADAARAAGRDEALVYDVKTGEVYYLLTRVKRRAA